MKLDRKMDGYTNGSQNVILGSVAASPPGKFWKMQILRVLPRPTDSETGSGARNLNFNIPPCLTPGDSDTC